MTTEQDTIDIRALPRMDLPQSFSEPPPPIDMVLPGLVCGTMGALVAMGGVGKSWVALQTAIAVAGGPDLIGMGVQRTGPVLYLPAEDPSIALRHRLWAAGSRLTPPIREQLYQSLEIVPLIGHVVDLLTPVWADALERMAEGRRLVVIDTLRRFHLGDENSGGDMVRLLGTLEGICSRTGATILFLHHTSKAAALNGGDQQQASRGSSVLVDNIRGGQWNLVGMTEGEAGTYGVDPVRRRSYVRLLHAKTNYGEPPLDTWLRRDEGGLLVRAELERVGDGGQRQDERPHGGRRRTHG